MRLNTKEVNLITTKIHNDLIKYNEEVVKPSLEEEVKELKRKIHESEAYDLYLESDNLSQAIKELQSKKEDLTREIMRNKDLNPYISAEQFEKIKLNDFYNKKIRRPDLDAIKYEITIAQIEGTTDFIDNIFNKFKTQ